MKMDVGKEGRREGGKEGGKAEGRQTCVKRWRKEVEGMQGEKGVTLSLSS